MDSHKPELVSKELEKMLRTGDLDGLMGLYESDAVFADLDGVSVGLAGVRMAHEKFLDSGLGLTLNDSVVLSSGDIALVHWSWTVSHGDGFSTDGVSAEVLRRQADGSWKYVIDNSDGSALVGFL